jgi:hypothetical protein
MMLISKIKGKLYGGKVLFADLESGKPRFWGYEFDGKGKMTNLIGELNWKES